jgi:hypothetical protein
VSTSVAATHGTASGHGTATGVAHGFYPNDGIEIFYVTFEDRTFHVYPDRESPAQTFYVTLEDREFTLQDERRTFIVPQEDLDRLVGPEIQVFELESNQGD